MGKRAQSDFRVAISIGACAPCPRFYPGSPARGPGGCRCLCRTFVLGRRLRPPYDITLRV